VMGLLTTVIITDRRRLMSLPPTSRDSGFVQSSKNTIHEDDSISS
jgi:hypothetical protein